MNTTATESALPISVHVVAVLLIVQGVVRLAFLANGLITGGARMLVNAPVQFIMGFLLPGILGILAITAGIVILVRSPIARGFGLVTSALLLLTQFYFFAAVLAAYSRIQQTAPDVLVCHLGDCAGLFPHLHCHHYLLGIVAAANRGWPVQGNRVKEITLR